jgi:kinesin family protein 4/21/27
MGQSAPSNAAKRHPTFTFDQVLDQESSQADLYDATARDVVDEYLKGHNITFLAYGQTSSGKSYSMGTTGEDVDYHGTEFTARTGLIPRTVKAIFDQAEAMRVASGLGASWECRLSFLELYNEEIIDLLSGSGVQIAIREERDGRIIWSGVKEVPVRSLAEVMHYLQDGSTKRKTGETGMNATSSRSHAIFSLTLTQKRRSSVSTSPTTPTMKRPVSYANLPPRAGTPTKGIAPPVSLSTRNSGIPTGIPSAMPRSNSVMSMRDDEMVVVTSKFNMVDLAGSERLKRTAAQGERMREGISINSGLSALGNVISACELGRYQWGLTYRGS